jgi:3-oxoacyl-[acyl-carrier-protein] synthase-3
MIISSETLIELAVNTATRDIKIVMQEAMVTQKEISFYLLHQANLRILETIREFLDETDEKFPKNIHKYGNTSAASIPILLDEMNREGHLKAGDWLVMCAFGAGFSSGACVLEW